LFLSAFGFFFSRLLLIWPFAILSSLLPGVAYSSGPTLSLASRLR
jgi:hypothetical protein